MKKQIIFFAFAFTALLAGCTKKTAPLDTQLVKGVELPPLTEQFVQGASITVKGVGFVKNDQIVFRTQTAPITDIVALVTEVNSTQIVFVVPTGLSVGEIPIVLKRGVVEQLLGPVSIVAAPVELPDAVLYGFGQSDGHCVVYQIDKETGAKIEVKTIDEAEYMSSAVVVGHVAYGLDFPERIGSFDFDTKTYKNLGEVANFGCLGVIDGKLHVITSNQGAISLSQVDTQTGALTLVADFGKVEGPAVLQYLDDIAPFIYDAQNKTILMLGWWKNSELKKQYWQPITLNIDTKVLSTLPRFDEAGKSWGSFFSKADHLCATIVRVLNSGTPQQSIEYELYPLNGTYELGEKLVTIKEDCSPWQYDTKEDAMYAAHVYNAGEENEERGLCSFDFKTGVFNVVAKNVNIDNVLLVR